MRNYQRELDEIIEEKARAGIVPTLLLHSCCAPCSSYVLIYLSKYFKITVYYYNPNIFPEEEYEKRVIEQKTYIDKLETIYPIHFKAGIFKPEEFYDAIKGFEGEKEGGARCFACYKLRLEETANQAVLQGYDYFTTTLSISPLKNASILNEIGERIGVQKGIAYLVSDFKKKNGYLRSTELSKEYGMYRQNYCGCLFSKKEREEFLVQKGNCQELNNVID